MAALTGVVVYRFTYNMTRLNASIRKFQVSSEDKFEMHGHHHFSELFFNLSTKLPEIQAHLQL